MKRLALTFALALAACGPSPEWVEVSVLTIDLHQDLDFWPDRFPLVADEVAADPPDLLATQEVRVDLEQPAVLARMIRDRDSRLVYDWHQERRSGDYRVTGEGLAIFSRHPIATRTVKDLGEGRVVVFDRLRVSDRFAVDLYDVHLDQISDEATRKREVLALLALVAENDRGYPTLVAGSFVSTPDGAAVLAMKEAGFVDTWAVAQGTPNGGYTEPVVLRSEPGPQMPTRRVDYVFLKTPPEDGVAVRVKSAVTSLDSPDAHGLYPSDHFGVLTKIEVDLSTLP